MANPPVTRWDAFTQKLPQPTIFRFCFVELFLECTFFSIFFFTKVIKAYVEERFYFEKVARNRIKVAACGKHA